MSEYVHGPYSWIQIMVFFLVGSASLGVARQAPTRRGSGLVSERPFLIVWAIGMIVAGLVDVEDQLFDTEQGAVHNLVVKVAFVALLVAACFERRRSGNVVRGVRSWLTLLLAVAMVATAILDGEQGYGAAQRALGSVALIWIISYAHRGRGATDTGPGPVPSPSSPPVAAQRR
jgi:hypothetical protein